MANSINKLPAQEKMITEELAVARLKQGDLTGLEVLVKTYQVKAVQAAVLVLHDRELAEEVAQNAFFNAAQKIHQFDSRRPFGPWFMRSVINAALQEANRQKRMAPLDAESDSEVEDAARWLIDPSLCPEDLVENEALYAAVWKALDQLPPHQRAAVVMRYFHEYTEREITQSLQRPLTTIKWWLFAAREKLRRTLQRDYFTESHDPEVNHE